MRSVKRRPRRSAAPPSWAVGERIHVEGWLQRRFWDAGEAGRRSRLQVVAVEFRPGR
ncbi:MAG TPA: hypothetical protein VHF25_03795 [Nitriliruptorales bacterium]|nr:hypothetical protein [Nitriliruptorales bacterium]